jgi:vacuolar protein sorting-associated protein 54
MENRGKYSSSCNICYGLTTKRLQRDAEFLQSKLSKIDGFGNLGEHLLELVKKKTPTTDAKENGSNGADTSSSETNNGKKSPPA